MEEGEREGERKSVNWTWLNFSTPYGTPLEALHCGNITHELMCHGND